MYIQEFFKQFFSKRNFKRLLFIAVFIVIYGYSEGNIGTSSDTLVSLIYMPLMFWIVAGSALSSIRAASLYQLRNRSAKHENMSLEKLFERLKKEQQLRLFGLVFVTIVLSWFVALLVVGFILGAAQELGIIESNEPIFGS